MATIDNLFDSGKGRVGNLVVYKMNGMGIIRTKPKHYHDWKSPAPLTQRQRLQAVNNFLNPFSGLLKLTFSVEKPGRTARSGTTGNCSDFPFQDWDTQGISVNKTVFKQLFIILQKHSGKFGTCYISKIL